MDGSYIPHYTTTELLGPLRQIRQIFPSNPSNPSKSQSSPGPSVKSVKTMELLGPLRQIRQIRQNHGAPRAPTTPLCSDDFTRSRQMSTTLPQLFSVGVNPASGGQKELGTTTKL